MFKEVSEIKQQAEGYGFDCSFDGKAYETERELLRIREKSGLNFLDVNWSLRIGESLTTNDIWLAVVYGKKERNVRKFHDSLLATGWTLK